MKTKFFLATGLALLPILNAVPQAAPPPAIPPQQAVAHDNSPAMTEAKISAVASFQTKTISHIFGLAVETDGAIPRAFRANNPLQLINPLAPPEYGNGWDNVTTDPQTGRANGIVFFGIRF